MLFHATTIPEFSRVPDFPLVSRSRILEQINSASRSGAIVWIIGPLGAGKTTLAYQWATELDSDVQYVSARPMRGLLTQSSSDMGSALQDLLNICSRDPGLATEAAITDALEHVVAMSQIYDQPIILDDLELIRRDNLILLQRQLAASLPRMNLDRILFISRTLDENLMRGLQAQRSLRIVLPSTLEFDAEEATEAYHLGIFGTASLEAVQSARESSAGWITGILADLHGHGGRTISPADFTSNILNSMVLHQPPTMARVMHVSTLLPVISREIWNEWFTYLGIPNWLLHSLSTQLPTRAHHDNPDLFEIVPVMRRALSQFLKNSVHDDDIEPLLRIAMSWYVKSGFPHYAIKLAIQEGLEAEYLKLIKPMTLKLSREENWPEIARLVEDFPIEDLIEDAEISSWYGFALASATRYSEVINIHYHLVNRWGTSTDDLAKGRMELSSGFIARARGNYQSALKHFSQAFEILPEEAHQERMYAAASAGTSASQIRLGSSAFTWQRRASFELAHLHGPQRWWHSNAGPLNLGYIASAGQMDTAYEQAKSQVEGLMETTPEHSWRYLILMSTIDAERTDFERASETLNRARAFVQTPLQKRMWTLAEASLLAAQGHYESAKSSLKMQPFATGHSIHNNFHMKATMAKVAFDSGEPTAAELVLENSAWPMDSWPRNFGDAHPNLIKALIYASTRTAKESILLAEGVLNEAKYRRSRYFEIRSHVVLAYINHQAGDIVRRNRELQTAVELNATSHYRLVFFIAGIDLQNITENSVVASNHNTYGTLTPREIEILELVAQSYSNKKIAETLFVSLSTVKNHLASVYDKLNTNNRRTAVQIARSLSLIPDLERKL